MNPPLTSSCSPTSLVSDSCRPDKGPDNTLDLSGSDFTLVFLWLVHHQWRLSSWNFALWDRSPRRGWAVWTGIHGFSQTAKQHIRRSSGVLRGHHLGHPPRPQWWRDWGLGALIRKGQKRRLWSCSFQRAGSPAWQGSSVQFICRFPMEKDVKISLPQSGAQKNVI